MKTTTIRYPRRLVHLAVALACALGAVTGLSTPAFAATVSFDTGSSSGDVWGTVSRVNDHTVKINASLYNDTGAGLSWQACWGYTEYGAFYQAGCNSLRYNNRASTTKSWSGLTYNDPNAAIGWVYVKLFVNGQEASSSDFVWP